MNVSIPAKALRTVVDVARLGTSSRSLMPVLAYLLITANENGLTAVGTDLTTTVVAHIPADVKEPGSIAVVAKVLGEVAATLDGDVTLSIDGGRLRLKTGSGASSIATMDAGEFPPLPLMADATARASFGSDEFTAAARRVAFAVAQRDDRPPLDGIHVFGKGEYFKDIVIEAADGYRLSRESIPVHAGNAEINATIPAAAIKTVLKIAPTGTVTLTASQNVAEFRLERDNLVAHVYGQLHQQPYPDLGQIIPGETPTTVDIPRREFLTACKQAEIFARNGSLAVALSVTDGKVEVAGKGPETGSTKTAIDATVTGPEQYVHLNARYLREFLDNADGDSVRVGITEATLPIVFTGGENFVHVIMPMNLGE